MKSLPSNFTLLILLFLSISGVQAQENDTDHSLIEGSKAFQFQITENFSLGSFTGSALSYKNHISAKRAHRIGLSFENISTSTYIPEDDNEREASSLNSNFIASFTWMNYTDPEAEVKFYYGFGPAINFGLQKSVNENINIHEVTNSKEIGLSGLVYSGVEWFFHPSISLHAEYGASAQVNFMKQKYTIENKQSQEELEDEFESFAVRVGSNGVKFGLSVYF